MKNLELNLGDLFLSQNDVRVICNEILSQNNGPLTVAIDGPPGAGKTVLTSHLVDRIKDLGLEISHFGTDLEVKPRSARAESSDITDWHEDQVIGEVLTHPGAIVEFAAYNLFTHNRDVNTRLSIPSCGVTIIEGMHSIDRALKYSQGEVITVRFNVDDEAREKRRTTRNIVTGRWVREEAESRTSKQRLALKCYYADLDKYLRQGCVVGTRNELLSFSK